MSDDRITLESVRPRVPALEQTSPPYWNRSLYCFELKPDYQKEHIIGILSGALKATLASLPVLGAQVVSAQDGEQEGKKDLVPGGHSSLFINDLTSSPLVYDDLRKRDFPTSMFDDRIFWATPCLPSPQDKVPVFAVQGNFVRGGLLLGVSFWHLVMDGIALATTLRIFSQHCLYIQEPDRLDIKSTELSADIFDKSSFHDSTSGIGGQLSDHPEYIMMPSASTGPPPFMTIPLSVEVFHISSASLKALKVAASPVVETSTQDEKTIWVSTNDALTALIWRSIMVATYGATDYQKKPESCCQSAVNGRPKMDPPLHPDYFGCALTFATIDHPLSSILAPNSLPTIALMIRQSIMKVTAPYIESLVTMMRKIPDYRRVIPRSFVDLLGRGTVMTSWAAFPLYDYDWGPALGGKCERVRAPKLGMFNGLQTVLPALPERLGGGYEVMIGLEAHIMERLKEDELWRRFCTPIEG